MRKEVRFIAAGIALAATLVAANASEGKKKPAHAPLFQFSGTIIDNKSLKDHADSISAFLPRLTKEDVHDNVKAGYSLIGSDGTVYKLAQESVQAIWNDIKSPSGGCTLHSMKIAGRGWKLGQDSLKILMFHETK